MRLLLLSLLLIAPALACGPWFPDTVLDKPQAALDVPAVCFVDEIHALLGVRTAPMATDIDGPEVFDGGATGLSAQIPAERKELEAVWTAAGLPAAEVQARAKRYADLRQAQLANVSAMGFRLGDLVIKIDENPFGEATPRPLADILPADVAAYVEGVRLLGLGKTGEARAVWLALLDQDAASRKRRSVWAAWMLAKTSEDDATATSWYQRVIAEASAGGTDVLGLAAAARAWLGPRAADPVQGLHLLAEAVQGGQNRALIDIRRLTSRLFDPSQTDAAALASLARDPLARAILNIDVFPVLDGYSYGGHDNQDGKPSFPYAGWLAALEALGPQPIERADRVAWALYSWGDYPAARSWLAKADPAEPRTQWLTAKFALRDGKLDPAAKALGSAVASASSRPDWSPANPLPGFLWVDAVSMRTRVHGKLLADDGQVAMSRRDYPHALGAFLGAGYWEDAAYIAERVLDTGELLDFVRARYPEWTPAQAAWCVGAEADPAIRADAKTDNGANFLLVGDGPDALRYLLGRRLARESRFPEAREFLPSPLLPLFDHFAALDAASKSGQYRGRDLAAILWRLAEIQRHFGMKLQGTEGPPDGTISAGAFEATEFATGRSQRDGWIPGWRAADAEPAGTPALEPGNRAIPPIDSDEVARAARHRTRPDKRFHYRYLAAETAWKAAALLPDNDLSQAYMLNTAGRWLGGRDREAADRFYQALVRRNPATPVGQAADKKRWFVNLDDVPPGMPALPDVLRPRP